MTLWIPRKNFVDFLQGSTDSTLRTATLKKPFKDFPGGTVVKNPPANAGDTGSIPGPGGSHMPWSN